MQRNSIIPPRPAAAWQRSAALPCADTQATYGCVDWYLYQSPPAAALDSTVLSGPGFAAPCSSIIERATEAAGAAVARTATPSPA
jgi:hypothetical protein